MSDPDRTSLEKGLALIQEVASAPGPLGVSELAGRLGISRASGYRLCDTLARSGWLHQAQPVGGRSRSIELGPQALGFSVLVTNKYDQDARLTPIIEELSRTVGETVHAGMLDGTDVVHVARAHPDDGPHMALPLGARVPAHVTALGKALLATLPRESVLHRYPIEQLPTLTVQSIATRSALLKELEVVADRGYALDEGESRSGVRCVGAPVFGWSSAAMLAISVTTTPEQLADERLAAVATEVRRAASVLTATFGGVPPANWDPPDV